MSSPVATRPWRLSCADSAFPRVSHAVALAVIKDLGIDYVDVCVFAGHDHNPPDTVVADPLRAADAARSRLDAADLAVADVFVILSDPYDELAINHPHDDVRDEASRRILRMIEFAGALDSPGVTMLPGVEFDGIEPRESRATAAVELQRLAEIAGASALGFSIEPHFGSITAVPATASELLAAAPDLRLTLDHGHFVYQGLSQRAIDELIPASRHIQVRQAERGDMQTRARYGAIDYAEVLDGLERAGYEGFLGLEYQWDHWMDFNRVDCISETAELRDVLSELGIAVAGGTSEVL